MKFTVSSVEIQRTLNKLSGVLPTRSTMPILENILFDLAGNQLSLTATDLALSLTVTIQVRGMEDGRIAIPAKRIIDTMRSLPDTSASFTIDTATNRVRVTTETGEYNLTGEGAKEYPQVPAFQSSATLLFESNKLKELIHRTVFAVSSDELRPAMMGVLFQVKDNTLRAVSTDGHRLVRYQLKDVDVSSLQKDIIVPAKALNVLTRILEGATATLDVSATHARFSFESSVLLTRLLEETYPNYESVIPSDNERSLTVQREPLMMSLRRVALYASASTHQVRLSLGTTSVEVSAQDIDFGGEAKETVPCTFAGEKFEIGFNSIYLTDILTHLDSDQVEFKFSSPTRAAVVSPMNGGAGVDILMLVMPVRLNT
jgi:DNA polymerase-3 subunit beta